MSVSTSFALKAGFLSTSLIRSLIGLAFRECLVVYAFKIASLLEIMLAASFSNGGTNPFCMTSGPIPGTILGMISGHGMISVHDRV